MKDSRQGDQVLTISRAVFPSRNLVGVMDKFNSRTNRLSSFIKPFLLSRIQVRCKDFPALGMVVVQPFNFLSNEKARINQLSLIRRLKSRNTVKVNMLVYFYQLNKATIYN